jgi:phosphoketolase
MIYISGHGHDGLAVVGNTYLQEKYSVNKVEPNYEHIKKNYENNYRSHGFLR